MSSLEIRSISEEGASMEVEHRRPEATQEAVSTEVGSLAMLAHVFEEEEPYKPVVFVSGG